MCSLSSSFGHDSAKWPPFIAFTPSSKSASAAAFCDALASARAWLASSEPIAHAASDDHALSFREILWAILGDLPSLGPRNAAIRPRLMSSISGGRRSRSNHWQPLLLGAQLQVSARGR